MISFDPMRQTVSLLTKSGIWITVSHKVYVMHGLRVFDEIEAGRAKVMWDGEWDTLQGHGLRQLRLE